MKEMNIRRIKKLRFFKIFVQKDTTYETFFVLLALKSEVIFRLSTKKC